MAIINEPLSSVRIIPSKLVPENVIVFDTGKQIGWLNLETGHMVVTDKPTFDIEIKPLGFDALQARLTAHW